MNVLVTGGTGFLGQHVAKRLMKRGDSVSILGRNKTIGKYLEKSGFKFFCVNIEDQEDVFKAAKNHDCVVHCAGLASPTGSYQPFFRANVLGTKNIVAACEKWQIENLVNISTPSVYFNYEHATEIKESDPLPPKPATFYAATKLEADQIVDKAVKSGLKSVSLRPRAIFGPGDNIVLPRIIDMGKRGFFPLVGSGESYVDLSYVDNVVDAVLLAMNPSDRAVGEVFNITNGEPMMVKTMVEKVFGSLGKEIRFIKIPFPVIFGAASLIEKIYQVLPTDKKPPLSRFEIGLLAKSQTLDIQKARDVLGYAPRVSINEGLSRFVASL